MYPRFTAHFYCFNSYIKCFNATTTNLLSVLLKIKEIFPVLLLLKTINWLEILQLLPLIHCHQGNLYSSCKIPYLFFYQQQIFYSVSLRSRAGLQKTSSKHARKMIKFAISTKIKTLILLRAFKAVKWAMWVLAQGTAE